jgi:DNA-binding transcriptional regulator YdaS (Cro superfamily)
MKVFNCFNSYADASRALGVSGEAVRKWVRDGVPAERVINVSRATGWKETPHSLRPDLYPSPDDAIPKHEAA